MEDRKQGAAARSGQRLQMVALEGGIGVIRLLRPATASAIGGWLARTIGTRLGASRVADGNLRRAMPSLDGPARRRIIREVWDNLGRNATELPHLASFRRTGSGPGWEIEGEAHIDALKLSGVPVLFFSGHLGNWEMILPIAAGLGMPVSGFYRAASNPAVDRTMQSMRQRAIGPGASMFPKGPHGARQAIGHLRGGGSLGFLVDQKMNDGIAVPFFGRDAMTAPALAQLAIRFGLPVVPVHVVRLGRQRFRLVCEAPLEVILTGNRVADVLAISSAMNETLERWIRERPGSWLWLHRRWPKDA